MRLIIVLATATAGLIVFVAGSGLAQSAPAHPIVSGPPPPSPPRPGPPPVACEDGPESPPTGTPIRDESGLSVPVPSRRSGIFVQSYGSESSDDLVAFRKGNGDFRIGHCGRPPLPPQATLPPQAKPHDKPAPPTQQHSNAGVAVKGHGANPCKDGGRSLNNWKWDEEFAWSFNAKGTPGGISRAKATKGLKAGVKAISRSRNNCGLSDKVSAIEEYQGRTNKDVQLDDGACESNGDGASTVRFASLDDGILGASCTWFERSSGANTATESDIVLNMNEKWTTGNGGKSCKNQWSIRAVMAHEAGHAFGLDHVDESSHGKMTMSTLNNGVCQDSEYTLGKGDVLALRERY